MYPLSLLLYLNICWTRIRKLMATRFQFAYQSQNIIMIGVLGGTIELQLILVNIMYVAISTFINSDSYIHIVDCFFLSIKEINLEIYR